MGRSTMVTPIPTPENISTRPTTMAATCPTNHSLDFRIRPVGAFMETLSCLGICPGAAVMAAGSVSDGTCVQFYTTMGSVRRRPTPFSGGLEDETPGQLGVVGPRTDGRQ